VCSSTASISDLGIDRKELLREGVECLLAGDLDSGKAILRDYINATIGFHELSRRTKRPAKSLMRMLGPSGNPQARNLLEVIQSCPESRGTPLRGVTPRRQLGDVPWISPLHWSAPPAVLLRRLPIESESITTALISRISSSISVNTPVASVASGIVSDLLMCRNH